MRSLQTWALLTLTLLLLAPTANAQSIVVIDDFEDGDTNDWLFFGGNGAGGGGGAAVDRPAEGNFYMTTGWGGLGTGSSFYGGFFRNLPNGSQITPPEDGSFSVWVYHESATTATSYRLAITLREDTDGNGWVDGLEDSIGYSVDFTTENFNDQWVLVSAPLSSFIDRGSGGNGTFDGDLDEVAFVIEAVEGASGAVIEVDFDQLMFVSGSTVDAEVRSWGGLKADF